MKNIIEKQMSEHWHKAGIEKGDIVLVHSSLKRTLKMYNTTPDVVLNSLLNAVGESGTLLLPLFNFDFTKGIPFDIKNTPSQMGVLTETTRVHPKAIRSGHPIYSFAAIGKDANKFNVDNFSGYGHDSPFAILRELNGKIAVIDLPEQTSMTFYHHVEEMNAVLYRYHKTFIGKYVTIDGVIETRTYGLFVRNLEDKIETFVEPAGELLWVNNLYSGSRPGLGHGMRAISATKMYDFITDIIQSGRAEGLLYISGD